MSIGERFNRSLISAGVREVADMNPEPKPAAQASVSELMSQLSSQTSRLLRDEMRLARKEFVESVTHAGIGAGLFSATGLLAVFGLGSVITPAIAALSLVGGGVGGGPDCCGGSVRCRRHCGSGQQEATRSIRTHP